MTSKTQFIHKQNKVLLKFASLHNIQSCALIHEGSVECNGNELNLCDLFKTQRGAFLLMINVYLAPFSLNPHALQTTESKTTVARWRVAKKNQQ